MSALTKFTQSSAIARHTNTRRAESTEAWAWNGPVYDYFDDLPGTGTRNPENIADVAIELRGLRRQGAYFLQERIGFAATPTTVEITTAERTVVQREGTFKPSSGGWSAQKSKLPVQGAASVRKAHVPAGELNTSADVTSAATGLKPARSRASAHEAMSVLPDSVSRSLLSAIPQPTAFIGQVVRLSGGLLSKPQQKITVLRADSRKAIVLIAERVDWHEAPWSVTECSFVLGARGGRELSR